MEPRSSVITFDVLLSSCFHVSWRICAHTIFTSLSHFTSVAVSGVKESNERRKLKSTIMVKKGNKKGSSQWVTYFLKKRLLLVTLFVTPFVILRALRMNCRCIPIIVMLGTTLALDDMLRSSCWSNVTPESFHRFEYHRQRVFTGTAAGFWNTLVLWVTFYIYRASSLTSLIFNLSTLHLVMHKARCPHGDYFETTRIENRNLMLK